MSAEDCHDLLRLIEAHGMLGLVHAAARAGATLPAPLAMGAARGAMAVAAHSALLLDRLTHILAAVAEAQEHSGVAMPVLVLKGPALALTLYDSVAERPFGDLDLLLPEEAMEPAAVALERFGLQRQPEETPGLVHHWTLLGRAPSGVPLRVELHRRLLASPPFDRAFEARALVEKARDLPLDAPAARTTGPIDTMLHLAGHLVLQHAREERLIWVADIDRVARRLLGEDDGAWGALSARATETGLAPAVDDALRAARHWFDTPVPASWRPGAVAPERQAAHRRLRARASVGREGARLWADVRGLPSARARLAYALRHVLPAPAYMRAWYGIDQDWRLPIYYARRLLRGLGHILALPGDPDGARAAAVEPPEQWMIDSQRRLRS
jgi:hypothetical protein